MLLEEAAMHSERSSETLGRVKFFDRMEYRRASSGYLDIFEYNCFKCATVQRRSGRRAKRNRDDRGVTGHEFPLKDKGSESAREREREREREKIRV